MPNLHDDCRFGTTDNGDVTLSSDERALCVRLAAGTGEIRSGTIAAARRHRLHLLLAESMAPGECDAEAAAGLKRDLTVAAGLDAWHERELRELLAGFGEQGIEALLFKGSALAYSVYAQPHLRPRIDADLLIRRSARDEAERVLAAHAWSHPPEPHAEVAAGQRHYVKRAPGNTDAHVDLHWRLANPQRFADVLSFDELWRRAAPIPALGPAARAAGMVDALLLACVHRVAHHGDAIDLLWLWDIHLLASRLSEAERSEFIALAVRTAMVGVSQRGLTLASSFFGTAGAAELLDRFDRRPRTAESSARFIGGMTPAMIFREDFAALPGWRARARLVSEHLFPPMAYMRTRYPRCPAALLPFTYAVRIARGAPKWLRRS